MITHLYKTKSNNFQAVALALYAVVFSHLNLTPILEAEHNAAVCAYCDFIYRCVPEGWGEFEVEDVEFFQGKHKGTEIICPKESAFSLSA